jgi:hypothetical protein
MDLAAEVYRSLNPDTWPLSLCLSLFTDLEVFGRNSIVDLFRQDFHDDIDNIFIPEGLIEEGFNGVFF